MGHAWSDQLRALVAPFLVDSLTLQRRVLESPLAPRLLQGVEPLGLVGLAVLPGPLRRPLGVTRTLLGPEDYEGATIGIGRGGVAEATFRALGATPREFAFGSGLDPAAIVGLDGLELDLTTVLNQGYLTNQIANALTTNVVFWPHAETISINRRAFDALASGERAVLLRAGRELIATDWVRIATLYESELLSTGCRPGTLTLAPAARADLAGLHEAVSPISGELEQDPVTRDLIAEIRKMRGEGPSDSLRCPRPSRTAMTGGPGVDGVWQATLSREELVEAGLTG